MTSHGFKVGLTAFHSTSTVLEDSSGYHGFAREWFVPLAGRGADGLLKSSVAAFSEKQIAASVAGIVRGEVRLVLQRRTLFGGRLSALGHYLLDVRDSAIRAAFPTQGD